MAVVEVVVPVVAWGDLPVALVGRVEDEGWTVLGAVRRDGRWGRVEDDSDGDGDGDDGCWWDGEGRGAEGSFSGCLGILHICRPGLVDTGSCL